MIDEKGFLKNIDISSIFSISMCWSFQKGGPLVFRSFVAFCMRFFFVKETCYLGMGVVCPLSSVVEHFHGKEGVTSSSLVEG